MKRALLAMIVCFGVGVGGFVAKNRSGASAPTLAFMPVMRSDLVETISGNGSVLTDRVAAVNFISTGTVESVSVAVGSTVRRGAVLAKLNSRSADFDVQARGIALRQAEVRLRAAQHPQSAADAIEQQASLAQAVAAASQAQRALEEASDGTAPESAARTARVNAATSNAARDSAAAGRAATQVATATSKVADARQALAIRVQELAAATSDAEAATSARGAAKEAVAEQKVRIATVTTQLADSRNALDLAQTSYDATRAAITDASVILSNADVRRAKDVLASAERLLREHETELARLQSLLDETTEAVQRSDTKVASARGARDSAQAALGSAHDALDLETGRVIQSSNTADQTNEGASNSALTASAERAQALRQAESAVSQANAAVVLARAAAASKAAPRIHDVQAAKAEVDAARISLTIAIQRRNETVLRAPFTGIVTTVGVHQGENVGQTAQGTAAASSSTSAFTIVDPNQRFVRLGLAEVDALKVAAGMLATVRFDSLNLRLDGTVTALEPVATTVNNVATYFARVRIDKLPASVRIGLGAVVDINVATQRNVLVVPSETIEESPLGVSTVRRAVRVDGPLNTSTTGESTPVQDQNVATQVVVRTGLRAGGLTEIVSGLDEGDRVVLPHPGAAGAVADLSKILEQVGTDPNLSAGLPNLGGFAGNVPLSPAGGPSAEVLKGSIR
jgi:multidrug efflux pump subunit AcrA (membrane-fusion protein)